MNILYPVALWLIFPLMMFLFIRPFCDSIVTVLRGLLYGVIVLALSGVMVHLPDRVGTLIVAIDRSSSMPEAAKNQSESFIRRIAGEQPSDSQLGVITFGAAPVIDKLPQSLVFDGLKSKEDNLDGSDLSGAIFLALQQIPLDSPGRILLLSDGLWTTSDPARAMAFAAARGVKVDILPLRRNVAHDLAITEIEAPLKVSPGEFYTLTCRIVSPDAQNGEFRVRRGNLAWETRKIKLRRGINSIAWRDRAGGPGVTDYTVEVIGENGEKDERHENNRARRLIEIGGRKPILLLTNSPFGNLGRVLNDAGIVNISRRPSPEELRPEKLANYAGVILENVPASSLGLDGMKLLAEMVKSGALGLMMTGGRDSFAGGGYFRSPIEEILPISMEQRKEMRKSLLALFVALDRSGSMTAPIGNLTKMDMANLATFEVFKLMMPGDEFGVIAVDSAVHTVIPLAPIEEISGGGNRILGIESMGGGIYTYSALRAATSELLKSSAKTRHLILFADASDAEEPGAYRELLKRTSQAGITVSVVALGQETDRDAEFLKDIAKLGNGMVYFSEHADELPRIFAQDTFLVARNTFVDEPIEGFYTNAIRSLTKVDLGKTVEFGGYNLCYAKPGSEILIVGKGELSVPLAAIGQAGLGKVTVLAAEADGKYTGKFASDANAGTLLVALANGMIAPDLGDGEYLVTQSLANGVHRVEIHLNPERERDPFTTLPVLNSVISRDDGTSESRQDTFVWAAPNRLEANIPLENSAVQLGTVSWPGKSPTVLSPVALIYSPEFQSEDADRFDRFCELAESTGGRVRLLPDGIWQELSARGRDFDLTPILSMIALCLLLLEVAERKFGLFRRKTKPRNEEKTSSEKNPSEAENAAFKDDSLTDALQRLRRRR
ncbi:MAG: VWA domain-containing protein [Victivallales bacterium]|jgi:hypothetical protein|nr:VWA domain-containing protein [Victivallales bacterium]